jgi:hypothetical protein
MCLEMVDGPLYGNSSRKQMIKHQHLDTNADGFGYVIWDVSKSNLVTFWAKFQWFCSFNNHILNHSNTFPHQMVGLHIPWRFPCSYPIMSPHSLCSLRNVTFFSSHSAFFFQARRRAAILFLCSWSALHREAGWTSITLIEKKSWYCRSFHEEFQEHKIKAPTIYKAYNYKALISGNIPRKYALIWYSSSILWSWNSHWVVSMT